MPVAITPAPSVIAFRDARHGIAGAGARDCGGAFVVCTTPGAILATTDGGRTWSVIQRTSSAVAEVDVIGTYEHAVLDDGANLASRDGGRHWHPIIPPESNFGAPCPYDPIKLLDPVETTPTAALCGGEPGGGSQVKTVYRLRNSRWKRVAWAPAHGRGHGIPLGGYPLGLSIAPSGFGLIWEDRGPLLATRDGGSHWGQTAASADLWKRDDVSLSGAALQGGVGFALIAHRTGEPVLTLIETSDAGRVWRVVHRWHTR